MIDKDNDEKAAPNLARLFAFAALLVFGAVTLAWWGFLAWLFWHVIVVAVHDGSSGLRNGVMLAPSGSPPILPSGDLMQPIAAGGQFVGFGWKARRDEASREGTLIALVRAAFMTLRTTAPSASTSKSSSFHSPEGREAEARLRSS